MTPDERRFLASFNSRYYAGRFNDDHDRTWTPEERRKSYQRNNAANQDLYEHIAGRGLPDANRGIALEAKEAAMLFEGSSPDTVLDPRSTPEYLDSPEYKAARDELRKHLPPPGRGKKAAPPSPELELAQERLRRIVKK